MSDEERLRKRLDDLEYQHDRYKDEENYKKDSNVVAIGAFIVLAVAPMAIGILTNDSEMAAGGVAFAVVFALGWAWWQWQKR
jgi:hypothetical protein